MMDMQYVLLAFCIAAAVLLVIPVVLTVHWFRQERYSGTNLTVIAILIILSIALARMPLNLERGESLVGSLLHGFIGAGQTISMDASLSDTIDAGVAIINGAPDQPIERPEAKAYAIFVTVQYITCVLLSGFVLVKTISRLLLKRKLKWYRRPVFIFSQMTKESIMLAQSIQASMRDSKHKGVFCFASVNDEIAADLHDAWQEAHLTNAFQLSEALSGDLLPRKAASISCILCNENENANLIHLSTLLEENESVKDARRDVKYFIYVQSRQAEETIDQLTEQYLAGDQDHRIICMINPKENLALQILDEIPLWDYARKGTAANQPDQMNVLILGGTLLADRFLRNAYSCGQLFNSSLSITMAAPNAEFYGKRLRADAPALSSGMNIVKECGELKFVKVANGLAADETILGDATYILVAYENDEENIKTAQRISSMIDKRKLVDAAWAQQPVAVVYAVKDDVMNSLCRSRDRAHAARLHGAVACSLFAVGSSKTQNSTVELFSSQLLKKAFFLDLAYNDMLDQCDADTKTMQRHFIQFMNKAYGRDSSMAAALHLKYREKLKDIVKDVNARSKGAKPVTLEEVQVHVEHCRWNAYMIMEGHTCPTLEQLEGYYCRGGAKHQHVALGLHPCLVSSKPSYTENLWAEGACAQDALDEVSLQLHDLALTELKTELKGAYSAFTEELRNLPAAPLGKAKALELAEQLTPSGADKARVNKLMQMLYKNYKSFDLKISRATPQILDKAGNETIDKKLKLFWLEVDEA